MEYAELFKKGATKDQVRSGSALASALKTFITLHTLALSFVKEKALSVALPGQKTKGKAIKYQEYQVQYHEKEPNYLQWQLGNPKSQLALCDASRTDLVRSLQKHAQITLERASVNGFFKKLQMCRLICGHIVEPNRLDKKLAEYLAIISTISRVLITAAC